MSSLKDLVSRVRWRMNEGRGMKGNQNGVTVHGFLPAVEGTVEVYEEEIGELEKKVKDLRDHETVLRVSRNLLELNETRESIRSKIESMKKLVQMFLRLKKETEQLIQGDLGCVSTEETEQLIQGDLNSVSMESSHPSGHLNNSTSQSDSSSEEGIPDQDEDPMTTPFKRVSSVQGLSDVRELSSLQRLATSTPKDPVRSERSVQCETKRSPFARKSRMGSSGSEISASQAAKSLETLLIPSTSRDEESVPSLTSHDEESVPSLTSHDERNVPSATLSPTPSATLSLSPTVVSNEHQIEARCVKEPSRGSLIHVTYDDPSKTDIHCPFCSVSFMSRNTLVSHIQSKHETYYRMYERINQLYNCKNTFLPSGGSGLRGSGLRGSGLMSESGKRTKECTVCGGSFSRDKLIDHCRTQHIFEVNNFIWIKNFSDPSNSWREFFMRIQGMDIEVEKGRSAAARKSNLKVPSDPVPKEPYDRLRIRSDLSGVKRTALPFNQGEIEATLTKRPRGNVPCRLIESDTIESRPKENQPRNPAKTPIQSKDGVSELRSLMKTVSKNRQLKMPNKSKGKETVPKSMKRTIKLHEFEVILTEVEILNLYAVVEPEQFFPPTVGRSGPKSKRVPQQEFLECNKCQKSYLEPLDLALHRLRFCKFRRPNLFRLTSAPSFGDSQDGGGDSNGGIGSRTDQDDPGPSNRNGGSSKEPVLGPNFDSEEEEKEEDMDEDEVMVPDAEKITSNSQIDGFGSPDSTSEVLVQSREEDGSNPESVNSESELSGHESDLEVSVREEEYEKLIGDCINKEVSVVVDLIDEDKIDMSMVAPRTRSILGGSDHNTRDSPIRDPRIRDPRIRDPRLVRFVVDAASIPIGSEVTL